jgi:hypothetical protein
MRTQEQARAVVLWTAVSFITLQLGLTVTAEYWLPLLRDPYYAYKSAALRRRLRGAERAKVVVVLGSSRVNEGVRGRLVEDELGRELGRPVILFNFGILQEGPMQELLNFERLLAEGVRPDLVVIEVLAPYLHEDYTAHLGIIPAERMGFRDRAVLARHHMPVDRLERYSWMCWAVPWYVHRLEILSVLAPRLVPEAVRQDWARRADESGWVPPRYYTTAEIRRRAENDACGAYGGTLQHFRLGNPFCPALGKVLARCRREHIPAALLLMPEATRFRALYSADARRQIDAFLAGLTAAYGTPLIDARTWVGDDGFFDLHHLLPEGAAVFTSRLGREAILPLLRGSSFRPDEDSGVGPPVLTPQARRERTG